MYAFNGDLKDADGDDMMNMNGGNQKKHWSELLFGFDTGTFNKDCDGSSTYVIEKDCVYFSFGEYKVGSVHLTSTSNTYVQLENIPHADENDIVSDDRNVITFDKNSEYEILKQIKKKNYQSHI